VIGGHTPGIAALETTARSSVCSLSRILRKRDRMASSSAGSTSYIVGWCVRRIVSYSSWPRRLRSNLHGTDISVPSVLGAHVKKEKFGAHSAACKRIRRRPTAPTPSAVKFGDSAASRRHGYSDPPVTVGTRRRRCGSTIQTDKADEGVLGDLPYCGIRRSFSLNRQCKWGSVRRCGRS